LPKHWCVIHTVLDTNPKHSTIQAARKEISSIPAGTSTGTWFKVAAEKVESVSESTDKGDYTGNVGLIGTSRAWSLGRGFGSLLSLEAFQNLAFRQLT